MSSPRRGGETFARPLQGPHSPHSHSIAVIRDSDHTPNTQAPTTPHGVIKTMREYLSCQTECISDVTLKSIFHYAHPQKFTLPSSVMRPTQLCDNVSVVAEGGGCDAKWWGGKGPVEREKKCRCSPAALSSTDCASSGLHLQTLLQDGGGGAEVSVIFLCAKKRGGSCARN